MVAVPYRFRGCDAGNAFSELFALPTNQENEEQCTVAGSQGFLAARLASLEKVID